MKNNPYASPLDNAYGQLLVVPLMAFGFAMAVWGLCPCRPYRDDRTAEQLDNDIRRDLERLNPFW